MVGQNGIRAVALALLCITAGCTGLGGSEGLTGGSATSVSGAQTAVIDGNAALTFNYSIDDYALALLESPDGEVITEERLEPDQSAAQMGLSADTGGTYQIVLRRDGETISQSNITLNESDTEITSATANWSGNTLQEVQITAQNNGDIPAYIEHAEIEARGTTVEADTGGVWVESGETRTVTISPSFEELTITEAGDVRGTVEITTSSETVTTTVERTFSGPTLEVQNISTDWNGQTLEATTVTVANTGDIPTEANVSVYDGSTELDSTYNGDIGVNSTATFELGSSYSDIYEQTAGGTVELTVVANSPEGFSEGTITHTVSGPDITLESVNPVWQNGQLQNVEYTVRNDGELEGEFTAETVVGVANDETTLDTTTHDTEAETTTTFELGDAYYENYYTPESGGDVSVSVSAAGQTETATTMFDGPAVSISNVDATFLGIYDSDDVELSSVSMQIENTGDVPLGYDSIAVEIEGSAGSDGFYSAQSIEAGGSTTEYVYPSADIAVATGSHEMTISLVSGGETVASETVTVTAE